MAVVSISEASRLVGKTRQTLYNDRDSGKLSWTTLETGKPGIDTSELQRVYGQLKLNPVSQAVRSVNFDSETGRGRQRRRGCRPDCPRGAGNRTQGRAAAHRTAGADAGAGSGGAAPAAGIAALRTGCQGPDHQCAAKPDEAAGIHRPCQAGQPGAGKDGRNADSQAGK